MPEAIWYRRIYGTAKQLGISNDEIHDAVRVGFAKQSLKELTVEECETLLLGMNRGRNGGGKNFSPQRRNAMAQAGRKDEPTGLPTFLANSKELWMVRRQAEMRGWSEEALKKFVMRQLKHPIRTMGELNKILWALKAMNRRDGLLGKYDYPSDPAHRHA